MTNITIPRKQMEMVQPIIKIIVGALSIWIIIGIFLILDGKKELQYYKKNNAADKECVSFDSCRNSFVLHTIERKNIICNPSDYLNLKYDMVTGRLHYGSVAQIEDLGFCEYSIYKQFMSALKEILG